MERDCFGFRFFDSQSDNLKFKTCPFDKLRAGSELRRRVKNLKSAGIFAIGVTFAMCGAVAQAQQPKKVARIGVLLSGSRTPISEGPFRERLRDLVTSRDKTSSSNIVAPPEEATA